MEKGMNRMLRESRIKRKLQHKELILRGFLRFPNPAAAEIMALNGIDVIVIDNEHYPFNTERVEDVVRAAQAFGSECMMRVPNPDPARISQMMDAGLSGVVVPHIESYEEAMQVVNAVKYAPVGTRGFCPITRSAAYGYGLEPAAYADFINKQTSIILMTETKRGLENLDQILRIPEVDAISIGPSDVAASYGCPGRSDLPEIQEAIFAGQEKIVAAGKALVSQAYNGEAARRMYGRGSRVLTLLSDVQMLTLQFTSWVDNLREAERQYNARS